MTENPILLIDFGSGLPLFSANTPADYGFSTTYQQRLVPTVEDGYFAFVNKVYKHYNDAWHTNATDHTGNQDGYMFLVNANFQPGQFYNGQVDNLCIGLRYEFSVYLANLCQPSNRIDPNVLFEVRTADADNTLLVSVETGLIPKTTSLTWDRYGLSFVATSSSVNLLMISNAPGGNGNDIVIDDIGLRVCPNEGNGFCPQ